MANNEGFAQEPAEVTGTLARLQAENAALRSRLRRRTSVRRWLSGVLVILSALLVVASTVAVWTYRTAFDTDRFMATVEPALDDPAFYSALGDRVSEQSLAALDLETRVANRLTQLDEYISQVLVDAIDIDPQARELISRFDRPSLAALAPPITNALEERIDQVVHGFISSEEFRSRFPNLVRQAHEASVALVRNDLTELPNVYLTEGEVRLNLIPIIRDALSRVIDEIREFLPDVDLPEVISDRLQEGRQQLGDALQAQLPEDFGQVTLMSEEALGDVQQTVHRLDRFVWLLLLVTVAMIAITIAVSPARRRTVVQLGVATVIGFFLGAVIIRRLQASILAEVRTPDGERAARALLAETMTSLRTVVLLVGAVALVSAVVAYVAGRPAWIGRLSERTSQLITSSPGGSELDRWVAANYDRLRIGGIVVAVVVIFITGFEIIPVLVVGVLLALFLWGIWASNNRATHAAPTPEPDDVTPVEV
jgi:hypothetical protein